MKTCKIEGCLNPIKARGLCIKHYTRLIRRGNPNIDRVKKVKVKCHVDGCEKTADARGYCHSHYSRYMRYGDPLHIGCERHKMLKSPEYRVWQAMKDRCTRKKNDMYHRYGGRGITICDNWVHSFSAFYNDMGPRPSSIHQIDRIDNNGNYEADNCHWVTPSQNNYNKSTNKLTAHDVIKIRKYYATTLYTQDMLARTYDVHPSTISLVVLRKTWREI